MEDSFSPKQVAEALKVSESSIKRWCDRGAISTSKTHGGHRRVTLEGLMAFLEATDRQILNPSPLGMVGLIASERPRLGITSKADGSELDPVKRRNFFEDALIRGDEKEGRKILSQAYASCQSFSEVCDELIAPTFHRLGERWHAAEIEIFQERRACEICTRLVHEVRRLMLEPPPAAPLAIGCTSSGDHYSVPGQLIEVVLREVGWRASNIGSNLPLKSLEAAVHREQPKLVWLSVSHIVDATQFINDLQTFWESISRDVSLVVGGRALTDDLRPQLKYTAHCDTMQQLSTLARTLRQNIGNHRYLPMQNRLNSESSTSSV